MFVFMQILVSVPPTSGNQTLLAGGVGGVGARVGESLATVLTLERLLARVNALVLLQMMLELESFATMRALKLSQVGAISMV